MIPNDTRVKVQKSAFTGRGRVIGNQSGRYFVRIDGPNGFLMLCGPEEVWLAEPTDD